MPQESPFALTQLLATAAGGDDAARQRLWSLIYDELRAMAMQQYRAEGGPRTLQPTALVHEAFLRLFGNGPVPFESRRHFFGSAARVMRQIRIDDARRRNRLKRGGGAAPASLDDEHGPEPAMFEQDPAEVLAIHEAVDKLAREDPQKAEVVNLRYFAGLNVEETAAAMNISPRKVELDWKIARAWLFRELSKGDTKFALPES